MELKNTLEKGFMCFERAYEIRFLDFTNTVGVIAASILDIWQCVEFMTRKLADISQNTY